MPDIDIVLKLLVQATDAGDQREIQSLAELGELLGLGDDDLQAIRTSGAALDTVLREKIPNGILPDDRRVLSVLTLFSDDSLVLATRQPSEKPDRASPVAQPPPV